MKSKDNPTASSMLKKDDLIVIGGAGAFIAGALGRYFHDQGFTRVRAIDKKPLPEWYQVTEGVESLCLDLSDDYLISIKDLVTITEKISGIKLQRQYDLDAPTGVAGRNSDNTFIKQVLGWEPGTPLEEGMKKTYAWIEQQYKDRKAGKRTVS
jgi:nucleoside-diphosphate-sugar epimerase